jgi:hypothetical protein
MTISPTGTIAQRRAGAVAAEGRTFRMSKALMGYVGQPPAYMILREVNALKARVAELERALALAEQELSLRDEGFRPSVEKESTAALA